MLDRIYCSQPLFEQVKVVQSTIFTKHRAVIAQVNNANIIDINKTRKSVSYRSHKPAQCAKFLDACVVFDWHEL